MILNEKRNVCNQLFIKCLYSNTWYTHIDWFNLNIWYEYIFIELSLSFFTGDIMWRHSLICLYIQYLDSLENDFQKFSTLNLTNKLKLLKVSTCWLGYFRLNNIKGSVKHHSLKNYIVHIDKQYEIYRSM